MVACRGTRSLRRCGLIFEACEAPSGLAEAIELKASLR
jgi:hypothetical protein